MSRRYLFFLIFFALFIFLNVFLMNHITVFTKSPITVDYAYIGKPRTDVNGRDSVGFHLIWRSISSSVIDAVVWVNNVADFTDKSGWVNYARDLTGNIIFISFVLSGSFITLYIVFKKMKLKTINNKIIKSLFDFDQSDPFSYISIDSLSKKYKYNKDKLMNLIQNNINSGKINGSLSLDYSKYISGKLINNKDKDYLITSLNYILSKRLENIKQINNFDFKYDVNNFLVKNVIETNIILVDPKIVSIKDLQRTSKIKAFYNLLNKNINVCSNCGGSGWEHRTVRASNYIESIKLNKFNVCSTCLGATSLKLEKHNSLFKSNFDIKFIFNNITSEKLDIKQIEFMDKTFAIGKRFLEVTPREIVAIENISKLTDELIYAMSPDLFPEISGCKLEFRNGVWVPKRKEQMPHLRYYPVTNHKPTVKTTEIEKSASLEYPQFQETVPDTKTIREMEKEEFFSNICPNCKGTGKIIEIKWHRDEGIPQKYGVSRNCPTCEGSGKVTKRLD